MGGMKTFLIWFVTSLVLLSRVAAAVSEAMPNCPEKCGNTSVPYPFGFGDSSCYKDPKFELVCNDTHYDPPALLFRRNIPVLSISVQHGRAIVKSWVSFKCYNRSGLARNFGNWINLNQSVFTFSNTLNTIIATGCDTYVLIAGNDGYTSTFGCLSFCSNNTNFNINGSCSGVGCCQTPTPKGLKRINITLGSFDNHRGILDINPCSYAFLAYQGWFNFSDYYLSVTPETFLESEVALDWVFGKENCEEINATECGSNTYCVNSENGRGHLCSCKQGYQGNPYLPQGCQDIDECEDPQNSPCVRLGICHNTNGSYNCPCRKGYHGDGKVNGTGCTRDIKPFPVIQLVAGIGLGFLFLVVCSSLSYRAFNQRKLIKLREKFFQQNGGLLLQQQISSRSRVSEFAKIFTVDDLKRATNNYDESRILGQGGSGTVYKGILPDNRVVAIKKSKIMEESQITEFINEVDVLSQINHRNVVKLLGCCLETEVPLLVYEFVSNGTLFHLIHNKSHGSSPLSWANRLRIAAETAGALAYLHSAHSIPVIHRDVKSANILLDENYTTKVSDFGASRLVPLDQTQMTTLVQGTLGYLDPECFHTGQLTDKSDVYSFGVVLVELLTGEKPLSSERPEEHRSLAMFFISSIKENRLFEILEDRVVNEGDKDQLLAVAELARRCLKVKGEERPTMKDVVAELDGLRKFQEHPWVQQKQEDTVCLLGGEPSNSLSVEATGQDSLGDHFILELEMAR